MQFHNDLGALVDSPAKCSRLTREQVRLIRDTGRLELSIQADGSGSIKDLIESLGIPHTEIGSIVADGEIVDFSASVSAMGQVDIHPPDYPLDLSVPLLLRPATTDSLKFVVDVNVGKIAKYLRLLGVDTAYGNTWSDGKILRKSLEEKRIILTRDKGLLKHTKVMFGRLVRNQSPEEQMLEVLRVFGMKGPFPSFSRCLMCNDSLHPVSKDVIAHRLQPRTKKYFNSFYTCPSCSRIFWAGSHYEAMVKKVRDLGIEIENAKM